MIREIIIEDPKMFSERYLNDELLPKEAELLKKIADDNSELAKVKLEQLINVVTNMQFHIIISFNSKELVKALHEHEGMLDNFKLERMHHIFQYLAKSLSPPT